MNILVVEDVPDVALTFAALLRAFGHRTQVAYDAQAALQMAREFRPQTVFVDLRLPGMDGYDLAAKLRGLPELDGTYLVSVSGHEVDDVKWREARFDAHLAKPVTVDALVGVLNVKEPHKLSR